MVSSTIQMKADNILINVEDFDLSKIALNACLDPVFIVDESGQILFANTAAGRVFNYNVSEMPGYNFSIFLSEDEFESYKVFLKHCLENNAENSQGQYVHILSSDRQKVKVIASVAQYSPGDSNRSYTVIAVKDLSEEIKLRKQKNELEHHYTEMLFAQSHYEEQAAQVVEMAEQLAMEKDKVEDSKRMIEYQACHDPLTGLGNRILMHKAFPELLTRAKACCGSVGFIYLDLDNFKAVNDRMGHNAGDQLLCDAASRIKECVGEQDVSIRLGGDEFAIVAYLESDTDTDKVYEMANKILEKLKFSPTDEFGTIEVTASIGVSFYPRDGHTLDMLLTAADTAMYDAKKSGKGRVR